jgi:hypothetical protein
MQSPPRVPMSFALLPPPPRPAKRGQTGAATCAESRRRLQVRLHPAGAVARGGVGARVHGAELSLAPRMRVETTPHPTPVPALPLLVRKPRTRPTLCCPSSCCSHSHPLLPKPLYSCCRQSLAHLSLFLLPSLTHLLPSPNPLLQPPSPVSTRSSRLAASPASPARAAPRTTQTTAPPAPTAATTHTTRGSSTRMRQTTRTIPEEDTKAGPADRRVEPSAR